METIILLLRLVVGLPLIIFGLHQLVHPKDWEKNIPDWLIKMGVPRRTTMYAHAGGNVLLGLFLLSAMYPLTAAWITVLWYATIVPSAAAENWSNGVRDGAITLAAIALVILLS